MSVTGVSCAIGFALLTLGPAIYACQTYVLLWLSRRAWRSSSATDGRLGGSLFGRDWPTVTTQIPLFNEPAVARRAIEAVAEMDYPRRLHEIQVLDDSTDETRRIVEETAARLRARGVDVVVLRRTDRAGYKAGALQAGLQVARGECTAIFDADFVPPRDFLRATLPLLLNDERVACVQTRWEHLNRDENSLTRAVALGVDGHFAAEQPGRAAASLALNFNGTAGVWRRSAIEDPRVGGWTCDTLTEDLDLSYRAQLAGWRIAYQLEPACPAEVPADMAALKAQQRRWATGSIQCATKLLPAVWRSAWSPTRKLAASIHLLGYSLSLWMVLTALFGRLLLAGVDPGLAQRAAAPAMIIVLTAAVAPTVAVAICQRRTRRRLPRIGDLLALLLLGLGLSVNNAFAAVRGLVVPGGEFVRTPKTGSIGAARRRSGADATEPWWISALELSLASWCVAQWCWFLPSDGPLANAFLLLFAAGLARVGVASLLARRTPRRATSPLKRVPHSDGALLPPPITTVAD